jgi:cytochrome c biogenesis protein CcdA
MSQSSTAPSRTISLNQLFTTFAHALAFVAGFSLIFIIGSGGTVTLASQFFGQYKEIIARVGGVIVILFGLATLDIVRIPWFYADTVLNSAVNTDPLLDRLCGCHLVIPSAWGFLSCSWRWDLSAPPAGSTA